MRLPDGIRRLFRLGRIRPELQRDLDDELSHYFDESVRRSLRHGLSETESLERARVRFGDERAYRATLRHIDDGRVRMTDRNEFLYTAVRTLSLAFRGIRRNPGFSASVVVILALGIGANAVMFGVIDRLLLSPPQHLVDADALRLLHVRRVIFNGETRVSQTLAYPDYRDFQEVGAFASVGAYSTARAMTIGRGLEAGRASVASASASLFPLLGVKPALGRFFGPDDDALTAQPTAVLAHEYWEREYGRDPKVIGSSIDVGQGRYTVIGITPSGFTGAELAPVDIWLPMMVSQSIENSADEWIDNRGWYWLRAVARMAPGVTTQAASAEATSLHRGGRAEMIAEGRYDAGAEVVVAPIIAAQGPSPTSETQVARWLAGVSLIVLLIACLNVTNLLLARATRNRREIAVRLTLGVSRARLIGELVTESVALSVLGAGAAMVVASFMGQAVYQMLLPNVAFNGTELGWRLLSFTLVATLVAGVLTGLLPALQASRTELAPALRAGGRSVSRGRSLTRVALLVGQAALSVLLLVGAGLFVRSLRNAQELDLGFDANRLVVVTLEWNETLPIDERSVIYDEVLVGVRRLPGIASAGLTYTVPFWSSISLGQPRVPGLDSIPKHHSGGPYVNKVGSGYFEAMRLAILQGRAIGPMDDAENSPPVAVLSASMAQAIWPAGDALGKCLLFGEPEENPPCTEVVGVVENSRRQELVEDDAHFLYYLNQGHPAFQGPPQALMAGTVGDATGMVNLLRDEARGVSNLIRFVSAVSMTERIEPQMRPWKLGASMFTVFGLLALVVAAWGLYSVLAFEVALRNHELAIRSALGASMPGLVRLVLQHAVLLVGVGVGVGLLAAAGVARFVEPLLFHVSGTDPATYTVVAVTLMSVATVAGALPAWRATRVDPREALQAD